mgnify:CR=1 FL=1
MNGPTNQTRERISSIPFLFYSKITKNKHLVDDMILEGCTFAEIGNKIQAHVLISHNGRTQRICRIFWRLSLN